MQVFAPGFLGFLGGYNATATTNTQGNASFPQAEIYSLPEGSSADVIVNWTDPSGVKYAGEGNWGVGFFGFTPDPLEVQLVTNLSIANESGPGGGFSLDQLFQTVEIAGIVFIVVVLGAVGYTIARDAGVFDRRPNYASTEP